MKIEEMFEKQREFNARVGVSSNVKNDLSLTLELQNQIAAMTNELEELRSHTHWKWWKTYSTPIDRHQAKIEIIDTWHFLMSAALLIGMDGEEFVELYKAKLALNHERQNKGYDENYEKIDEEGYEDNDKLKEYKLQDIPYKLHNNYKGKPPRNPLDDKLDDMEEKLFDGSLNKGSEDFYDSGNKMYDPTGFNPRKEIEPHLEEE